MSRLSELFPPTTLQDWKKLIEQDLDGASFDRLKTPTLDGIDLAPLYSDEPGSAIPRSQIDLLRSAYRARSQHRWQICALCDHPNLADAHGALLDDLAGGADAIALELFEHRGGVPVRTERDVSELLRDVDLDRAQIRLEPGASFAAAAALFSAATRGKAPTVSWGADPLGALASGEDLPLGLEGTFETLAELTRWTHASNSTARAVTVSTLPYHEAGASSAQELAFAAATTVEYLRRLEQAELEPSVVLPRVSWTIGVDCDLFASIARLRAARLLWNRIADQVGAGRVWLELCSRQSLRAVTRRDPHVNMLRGTLAAFAGAVGGADVVSTVPFDRLLGHPSDLARRNARNLQLLLREESGLDHVVDPAGGSWFIESLTHEVAGAAWTIFQDLERAGGMWAVLTGGRVGEMLHRCRESREDAARKLRDQITGVSAFANLDEPSPEDRMAARGTSTAGTPSPSAVTSSPSMDALVAAARDGASRESLEAMMRSSGRPVPAVGLERFRPASIFERLRDASDAAWRERGQRPTAFLADLGPLAETHARATFARSYFAAGGVQLTEGGSFESPEAVVGAYRQSGALVAVLCSSDQRYREALPRYAQALKEAGAALVVVVGRPGSEDAAWRAAGIDAYAHFGGDAEKTLSAVLRALEVRS